MVLSPVSSRPGTVSPSAASSNALQAVQAAWRQILQATCVDDAALHGREGSWREEAAERAARLWSEELLRGEGQDVCAPLRQAARARLGAGPIVVRQLDIHMVCPHHLTVAFGSATLGYVPKRHWAPFGALGEMLSLVCGRLIMQEEATLDAASALVRGLDAKAAWVRFEAVHPCHRVGSPRAHRARVVTEATAGERRVALALARHASRKRVSRGSKLTSSR